MAKQRPRYPTPFLFGRRTRRAQRIEMRFSRHWDSYYRMRKTADLRQRYLAEVDDPALRPKPLPPRPPRREKRRPGKPR